MKGELYIVCQGEVCQTKGKLHYLVGTPDPVDDQTYCTKRGQFRELVNSEKYWCIENRGNSYVHYLLLKDHSYFSHYDYRHNTGV